MGRVIAVANQKGGVAKTTTAVNLGIGLARKGKKVLLVDTDPQGSLTASLGYVEPDGIPITLANILTAVINEEEVTPSGGILHHEEDIDIMPGNIELSALEVVMGNVMSRELILKDYIDMMRERYDYILIDCMPSLGMMTINALVAADSVLMHLEDVLLHIIRVRWLRPPVRKYETENFYETVSLPEGKQSVLKFTEKGGMSIGRKTDQKKASGKDQKKKSQKKYDKRA